MWQVSDVTKRIVSLLNNRDLLAFVCSCKDAANYADIAEVMRARESLLILRDISQAIRARGSEFSSERGQVRITDRETSIYGSMYIYTYKDARRRKLQVCTRNERLLHALSGRVKYVVNNPVIADNTLTVGSRVWQLDRAPRDRRIAYRSATFNEQFTAQGVVSGIQYTVSCDKDEDLRVAVGDAPLQKLFSDSVHGRPFIVNGVVRYARTADVAPVYLLLGGPGIIVWIERA